MPNPVLSNLIRHNWITLGAATPEAFHASLQETLPTCTYWELRGSGDDYTEARNKSDLSGFIVLFTGGTTVRPDSSQLASPGAYADSNDGKGEIFVGVAPDNSAMSGLWTDAANPYGSARWSEFWRCAASGFTRYRIMEDKERIFVVFNNAGNGERYAAFCGAIIKPLSDDGSDETDGRLKGMMVSGTLPIADAMLGSISEFTSSYRVGNSNDKLASQCGIFLPTDKTVFGRIWRFGTYTIDTTSAGLKDISGDTPLLKLPYRMHDTPYYFVGYARQLYGVLEALDNQTIRTGAGTLIGYTVAASSTTVKDTLGLTNV